MEDIKKAIEEEIDRYLYETDGWTTKRCSMDYISNFILSKWEESERWRKVEEVLPEMGIQVLVKDKYGVCDVSRLLRDGWDTSFEFPYTHWKPIH